MHKFNSDSVEIAFDDVGQGDPVLLIHGFASNGRVNWVNTGWVKTLVDGGRRVITIDNRGHGESEKLYNPDLYSSPEMAEDVRRLLDHLDIPRAYVMGYSMGARIAAFLAINHPFRVGAAILAGLGSRMITGVGGGAEIARALEASTLLDVTDVTSRAFRIFAEQTRGDLKALAACIKSSRVQITEQMLATIKAPVLVVIGEKDNVAGEIGPLVTAIPGALGVTIPHRNHMSTVGDKQFKASVLTFLKEHLLRIDN
jgi:pimeloyl-ACP methyl ester carboxylesterase